MANSKLPRLEALQDTQYSKIYRASSGHWWKKKWLVIYTLDMTDLNRAFNRKYSQLPNREKLWPTLLVPSSWMLPHSFGSKNKDWIMYVTIPFQKSPRPLKEWKRRWNVPLINMPRTFNYWKHCQSLLHPIHEATNKLLNIWNIHNPNSQRRTSYFTIFKQKDVSFCNIAISEPTIVDRDKDVWKYLSWERSRCCKKLFLLVQTSSRTKPMQRWWN